MKALPAPASIPEKSLAAADIERLVLGSLLLNPKRQAEIMPLLRPGLFAITRHQDIFAAMRLLHERGITFDGPTVARVLDAQGRLQSIGGFSYLVSLDDDLPEIHNLDAYVRILEDAAIKREAVAVLESGMEAIFAGKSDALRILESTQATIGNLRSSVRREQSLCTLNEAIERLDGGSSEFFSPQSFAQSIPTPWRALNERFLGFRPGHLYVFGARPSHGKTIILAQCAQFAAEHFLHQGKGQWAAFWTLEQGREEIFQRLACANASVNYFRFQEGDLTSEEIRRFQAAAQHLAQLPLAIDDTASHDTASLGSTIARCRRDRPIGIAFVDYLQLVTPSRRRENRAAEVAEISRNLKLLARQERVPLVVASQVNRKSETDDKPPSRADLRESGAIEQDASLVALLWNKTKTPAYRTKPERFRKGETDLILAKQRNGPECTIPLTFEGQFVRFTDAPTTPNTTAPSETKPLWHDDPDDSDSIDL